MSVVAVLRIQKGEGRLTGLVAGLALVTMASFTIGESGIDALFFERVGTQALPLMYMLQGATTFAFMLALTSLLGRLGHRRTYLLAPIALGTLILVERALLVTGARWIYFLLWVTSPLAALLLAVSLWGIAGAVVDTRQAKRLFPIIAAGGILGTVLGGLVTRPLAPIVGAENLLLVWAGGLAVGFLLSRVILGSPSDGAARQARIRTSVLRDLGSAFAFVRRSRLLTWMTIAAMLFSVLFYTLYLPFARAASQHFPDANALAGFFGLFWAATTGAAFIVSVLITNRLFAWFGVASIVVVLPLLYAGAFGLLLIQSGFLTLVFLRFVMGTWLQGVASPAWETLTNVVPSSRRDQTRAFLIGGPAQIGTIIAGVIALVGQNTLTPRQFALIGLVTASVTVIASIGIRRSYASALMDALRAGRPQVFEEPWTVGTPIPLAVSADSVRVLSNAMRSSDVRERRLAFQLVAGVPEQARPAETAEGTLDVDPIVRLGAVRALDRSAPGGRGTLLSMIHDADAAVAAAAAARSLDDGASRNRLHQLLGDPDETVRRAAIEQLDLAPTDLVPDLIQELLADTSASVRAAALEQLARASADRALGPALAGFHDPDPVVRRAAGRTLGSAKGRPVEEVLKALDHPQTADAAVEAVRRMEIDGDVEQARDFIRSATTGAESDREFAAAVPSEDEGTRLLQEAVLDRGRRRARSGLWAATLLGSRRTEMETAIQNLDAAPGQLATALETLETAGDPAVVRPLIALWEPLVGAAKGAEWLSRALTDDDDFIVRCAEFIRANQEGGAVSGSIAAVSGVERVLFLQKVPLFGDLAPHDLDRVAQLVEERGYADGDVIAGQGEIGDELHIVVEGTIRVVEISDGSERELARRTAGDAVGEMSIITQKPRIASLVAEGPVRTIRLGHAEFESMLRERPGISLAVMRALALRLAEATGRPDSPGA
jgi:HEAT repeat protein